MGDKPMNADAVLEVRRRIAEQFDFDPKKMGAHYSELQKRYQQRVHKADTLAVNEPSTPYKLSHE